MSGRILRLAAVRDRTGLSRSGIYDLISKGLFPRQVQLGPRSVGWHEVDIDEWVTHRPIVLAGASS